MSDREWNALVALLNRVPLSPPEAMWVESLMERLRPQKPAPAPAAEGAKSESAGG